MHTRESSHLIAAASCRRMAALFNWGNILGILVPMPLGVLWLGASMVVYAMNRHHPNERVGHYTQQAAYRFYGVVGFFVAAAMFIPGHNWVYYLAAWVLGAAILVPWSVVDLLRIRREPWCDTLVEQEPAPAPIPHREVHQ